jgi:hypothetical protein
MLYHNRYWRKTTFLLFFLLTQFTFVSQAQTQLTSETIKYYLEVFNTKGINTEASEIQFLKIHELQLIEAYNFDSYRNEKTEREIQLERGPKLILVSLNELVSLNINVDPSVNLHKSNEEISENQNSLITKIDIGLGYIPISTDSEKWETHK